jgi:hypothetical protein
MKLLEFRLDDMSVDLRSGTVGRRNSRYQFRCPGEDQADLASQKIAKFGIPRGVDLRQQRQALCDQVPRIESGIL